MEEKISSEEWLRRKDALAAMVVASWQADKVPILIVVVEQTANIFCCQLAYSLKNLYEKLKFFPYPQIYLAYPGESLIGSFLERGYKVFRELEDGTAEPF